MQNKEVKMYSSLRRKEVKQSRREGMVKDWCDWKEGGDKEDSILIK